MVLISTNRLTRNLVKAYNDEQGLRLLVNANSEEIFIIGPETYHSEVATEILGMTHYEIKRKPHVASYLVSSAAEVIDNEVCGVITGMGSLEIKLKVGHTKLQLKSAHNLVMGFIENGQLQKSYDFSDRIVCPKILRM